MAKARDMPFGIHVLMSIKVSNNPYEEGKKSGLSIPFGENAIGL